jgi:hypothetical protein
MATIPPYRNYAAQAAIWNLHWNVGGGGAAATTAPESILLRTDKTSGSAVETIRGAIGFDPTLPGWCSDGPLSSTRYGGFLVVHVDKPSYPGTVIFKRPATALSASMTCAQLDAAWAAGTNIDILILDRRKWYLCGGFTVDDITNGIMLAAGAFGVGSFVFDICLGALACNRAAVMYRHYSYDIIDTDGSVYGWDTRPDLSALADYLDGTIPAEVAVRASSIQHSELDSAIADVDISELLRRGGEITLRSAVDPIQPGTLSAEPFGVVSLAPPSDLAASNIIDVERYRRIRGTPVTFGLDIVRPDNGAQLAELVSIRAKAGHAEQGGGALDIELTSPAQVEMDGVLCKFWPAEILPTPANPDVVWDNVNPVEILFDLLMNACPTTRWSGIYWSDWYWLLLRFGGTWHWLDLDATATQGISSLRSLWESVAALYGLFTSADLSGNIQVWHPAAYRPSLRVHRLNPIEDYASSIRLRGLESDQFDAVTLNYLDAGGGGATETYTGERATTGVDYGRAYAPGLPVDYLYWLRMDHARDALARQLLQRVQAPAIQISFDIGLRGLTWRAGDQLVVSSDILGINALRFMVTSLQVNPMDATARVEAVHYTGWSGGHSGFETAGPVGLWRWRDQRGWRDAASPPVNPTLVNQSWNPDKCGDMAIFGPGNTWGTMMGSWEAAGLYIAETGAVDVKGVQTTAVTGVGVDVAPSGVAGDQIDIQLAVMSGSVQFVGKAEYDWIWRWYDNVSGEGLALLLRSPSAPNPDTDDSCRLVLAHLTDCDPGIGLLGGANILASLELPYGFARPATAVAGYPGVIRSISVQWDAEDRASVYDGQRYIGKLTSTPAPAIIDRFEVRTPQIATALYCMTYLVRLTAHATAPTVEEMLPDDGLDPYYP